MKLVKICYLVLCFVIQVYSKGCSLPIETSDEQYMPIVVDNSKSKLKLAIPHLGNVELDAGETILLTCPNDKLKLTKTESAEAKCVSGKTLKISNKKKNFESVLCSNSLRGTAQATKTKCGDGVGYIIEIGFPLEDEFLTLIKVCYDADKGNTLYTTHVLYGKEIADASRSPYRPGFSTEELAEGINANAVYKQATQKKIFKELLGSAKFAARYIKPNSYLARGHLSPDADFLFASWQYATYFYVNTVPQWQAINNGNWKKIEGLSKDTAASYGENFRVYTGGYEVLSLSDIDCEDTEIYLSKDKLPIPKYVWKILHSEKSKKAIAFISLNNPFITELTTRYILCKDICDKYGWGNDAWDDGDKGFIYCCDAKELLKVISTGPEITISGILKGST